MAMPEPIGLREIKYLPEEINLWTYAMLALGSAFIIFVAVSLYLMWRTVRKNQADIEREALCESEKVPSRASITGAIEVAASP